MTSKKSYLFLFLILFNNLLTPWQKKCLIQQQQVESQDQQETNQSEEQVQNIIDLDCGLMPEYKAADYKSLESIKETFAASKNINDPNFTIPNKEHAIFFRLTSFNKEHLHKAIKYGIWTTLSKQVKVIEKKYQETLSNPQAQIYFYFFFQNQLFGMAKLKEGFNTKKSFQLWEEENKWFGIFEIEWIFIGKVDVSHAHIVHDVSQQQYDPYFKESGLKLFEFASKSDFQTVFNDFDSLDQKEKELRKTREDRESEYYIEFCKKHSEQKNKYEKGGFNQNNQQSNRGYLHKNNQGYYQHKQNYQNQNHQYQNYHYGQISNGNANKTINNNNAIKNMTNPNYQIMTYQKQQQSQKSIPYIQTPEDFERFIQSQPRIHFIQKDGNKKNMNKKYVNNNNSQQKGYKLNAKHHNQLNQFNNNAQQQPTDPTSSQSPTVENQEANATSTEQTQQVEQNVNTQQHQYYNKNYQYHNQNRYNGYNNKYYNNNNNNQQVNGNYYNKFQHYKNHNNNDNYQNYNQNVNNSYNNKKFNGNNNNRNFRSYNQNRQNRQNYNQSQGYQGDQNDFPELQPQNISDIQQQNQADDLSQVQQQMDAINISQQ
ncbi:hypothetical protein ABPG72_000491 [Tetrahymena utriculariae]